MFIAGRKTLGLIFLVLFFIPAALLGQAGNLSVPELKSEAKSLFEEGQYSKALEIYESLLERYPRDGEFSYYAGICLYKAEKDIPRSIEFLDYATSRPQVPTDVWYHLGQAYRKNYQFTQARNSFNTFNDLASKAEMREMKPDLEVRNSSNALEITMQYNPFEILATSLFSFSDSNYVKQVRGKGGRLQSKPEDLMGSGETQGDLTSYLFIPKNTAKGDYIYMAGYPRSRKNGSQLFRIRKNGSNNWGKPEELDALNTEYNEILPYFDPVSNDLYFATEGHKSMGGFDVFKSHYDSERDTWSEPVNLGFPLNSPEDEYLAMPGPDLGTILLVTNRQGLDSMLTVYKLILQEPKKSLANADNEELKRIGKLGGIAAIPEIVDLKEEFDNKAFSEESNSSAAGEKRTASKKPAIHNEEASIMMALAMQKKSDSLVLLANDTRSKIRSMPDPNDRWAWQRQIIEWEKMSKDYGEKADEIFAIVEAGKSHETVKSSDTYNHPATIEKDREIGGITVYRYTQNEEDEGGAEKPAAKVNTGGANIIMASAEKSTGEFHTADEPGEVVPPPSDRDPDMNRLVILSSSPYSINNPFPKDVNIPSGAFYRIQLGVFSHIIDYETFKGITPITSESVPGKDLTRYYAGKFSSYEKARDALEKVKSAGFNDAFIVSWYNGQKTSVNKVQELEKRDRP
jgi:tetratricopeptide (TPR) repeat protein